MSMHELFLVIGRTNRLGLLSLKNHRHSEKLVFFYQFRTDAPTYGHGPQYKADNDEAENERCV